MDKNKLNAIETAIADVEPGIFAIEEINNKWESVGRLVDEGEISNLNLISAVQEGLTIEQGFALRSLLELSENVPYEELASLNIELSRRIQQLKSELAEIDNLTSNEIAKLKAERDLLLQISPELESTLEPILTEEIKKVKATEYESKKLDLDLAELELLEAEDLLMRSGRAWPLPKLADARHLPQEGERVTIETFPNEHARIIQRVAERVERKFESRLHDASAYIAMLMMEVPGHVWTGEELGHAIYDDNEDPSRNASRVHSLISDFRLGKNDKMGELFAEKDLLLQRGKRVCYDASTGKRIPHSSKIVWRAVDQTTADAAQRLTTITSDRQSKWSIGEWETIREIRMRLDSIPSGNNDGQPIIKVDAPLKFRTNEKNTGLMDQKTDTLETSPETTSDWRDSFAAEVHEALEKFKEKGLLDEPTVSWKQLRRHLDSTIVATEMSRERAYKHKIIKRSEMSEDSLIDIRQAILVHVQNPFQHILGVTKNRKLAVEIVDEIVSGYYRSQKG